VPKQWAAVAVWGLVVWVVTPFIEEIAFRRCIQGGIANLTRSHAFEVLGSAVLFGCAHLGYPFWQPTLPNLVNSAWAAGFGTLLGTVAINPRGELRRAMGLKQGVT
jgi:membrane protease YdiL (CAAX protease family)